MNREIGEIFELNNEWYQCIEQPEEFDDTVCDLCDFHGIGNCALDKCSGTYRSDKKGVIFKKLEKIGEPLKINGKIYQRLISPYEFDNCSMCAFRNISCKDVISCYYNYIFIEIKQTKEDMEEDREYSEEEFKNNPRFQHHKNIEQVNNMKKMKPFNLEQAKAGKPVCTRYGRKARIICFDANIMPENKNILALIRKDDGSEYVEYYTSNGKFSDSKDDINDLMMLPETKEGWVNVYKSDNSNYPALLGFTYAYNTKEEAIDNADPDTTIATVKISWEK